MTLIIDLYIYGAAVSACQAVSVVFYHACLKVVTHQKVFFRKSLSKVTFERKLCSVSLAYGRIVIQR